MSFIDWSDSEGMLELLSEYVRDATNESSGDSKRHRFLYDLQIQINQLLHLNKNEAAKRLREIHISISQEYKEDPVAIHIRDCVEELDHLEG